MKPPVPSSSWTIHPAGAVTPLGEQPPASAPPRLLACAGCGDAFETHSAQQKYCGNWCRPKQAKRWTARP